MCIRHTVPSVPLPRLELLKLLGLIWMLALMGMWGCPTSALHTVDAVRRRTSSLTSAGGLSLSLWSLSLWSLSLSLLLPLLRLLWRIPLLLLMLLMLLWMRMLLWMWMWMWMLFPFLTARHDRHTRSARSSLAWANGHI